MKAGALRIATDADAPTEKQMLEARLRSHIARHDTLARELAEMKALIGEESRRYATLTGVTMRPCIDRLRHQLGVGR